MRAWFPIIAPPRTPRSLHHVERRRHRVMVQAAELRAPDRVIAGLERLEPVRVRAARDDVDLEQEIRKIERVRHVEGTQVSLTVRPAFTLNAPVVVSDLD